jgi:hypothetical protein
MNVLEETSYKLRGSRQIKKQRLNLKLEESKIILRFAKLILLVKVVK